VFSRVTAQEGMDGEFSCRRGLQSDPVSARVCPRMYSRFKF